MHRLSGRTKEAALHGRLRSKASGTLDAQHRFLVRVVQISAAREMWLGSAADDGHVQSLEMKEWTCAQCRDQCRGLKCARCSALFMRAAVHGSQRDEADLLCPACWRVK